MTQRKVILLVILGGGLTLFAWQNWSPSLSLVFLGMVLSIPLPLAVLILLALAAGVITGFAIAALFRWYSYLDGGELRRRPRYDRASAYPSGSSQGASSEGTETDVTHGGQTSDNATSRRESSVRKGDRTPKTAADPNAADDWEQVNQSYDDWEAVGSSTPELKKKDPPQGSKGDRSDSFYSIGTQEKSNSGVGKAEDVYEASYRVINPPVGGEASDWKTGENSDDEDWGLDEEEMEGRR